MELLIIRTNDQYIRVKPDEFLEVNLDKASVFPMAQLDHVRELETRLRDTGFKNVRIKKLVLTEEELS
ncbi:MAG: hypothetical protein MI747_17495 [Desulfobacterales bacterium]|nr:hypothetical protein [Desulfobacterales bacterium]